MNEISLLLVGMALGGAFAMFGFFLGLSFTHKQADKPLEIFKKKLLQKSNPPRLTSCRPCTLINFDDNVIAEEITEEKPMEEIPVEEKPVEKKRIKINWRRCEAKGCTYRAKNIPAPDGKHYCGQHWREL